MKYIKSLLISGSMMFALMLVVVTPTRAQSTDLLVSEERIVAVQAGTLQLNKGNASVALSESALKQMAGKDASYFVTLTATGETAQLKLQQKDSKQFTVREVATQGSNGSFDYVVFVKKTVYTGFKHDAAAK